MKRLIGNIGPLLLLGVIIFIVIIPLVNMVQEKGKMCNCEVIYLDNTTETINDDYGFEPYLNSTGCLNNTSNANTRCGVKSIKCKTE
jgi:hypothetical protein